MTLGLGLRLGLVGVGFVVLLRVFFMMKTKMNGLTTLREPFFYNQLLHDGGVECFYVTFFAVTAKNDTCGEKDNNMNLEDLELALYVLV